MCKEIIKFKKLTKKIDGIYSHFKCSYFVSVRDVLELKHIKKELLVFNPSEYPEVDDLIEKVEGYIIEMDTELENINKKVLQDYGYDF